MARPALVDAQLKTLVSDPLHQQARKNAVTRNGHEQWDRPAEFYRERLPDFPTEALPDLLQRFARGSAMETQVPIDMPAILALSVASASCAGNVQVHVRPGWREPINLYLMITLPPGNRKSATFRDALEPLEEIEREEALALRDEIARDASERRMLEERKVKLEKDAAKCDNPAERKTKAEEAVQVAQELASRKVVVSPRRLAQNVTLEQLASIMAEQSGRIFVASPEGEIFDLAAGRYANGQASFDIVLKGHSGDTARIDRRGRAEYMANPCLTLAITVQPNVLQGMAKEASFRGRGLTARFLYSIPASTMGRRLIAPPATSDSDRGAYHAMIRALASIKPTQDANGDPLARPLYFTHEANERLKVFERQLEPQLAEDGELGAIADWAGKLAGAVVRIAGVLWLAENAQRLQPWPDKIPVDAVERAIEIGNYFVPHAKAAFAEMGADAEVENAKRLLRWIEKTCAGSFTKRDAHQANRSRFKTVDEIDPALDLLESHNYIRAQIEYHTGERKAGRKASQLYVVNPHFLNSPEVVELREAEAIRLEAGE